MHLLDSNLNSCATLEVLVCLPFGEIADQVIDLLKSLKCRPYLAISGEDALKKIRFSAFNIIILRSGYSSEVQEALVQMAMTSRRSLFYVYIDSDVQTNDSLAAYSLSANLTVNSSELSTLAPLLEEEVLNYNKLYRMYYQLSKSQQD
jgi:hypothetical protein